MSEFKGEAGGASCQHFLVSHIMKVDYYIGSDSSRCDTVKSLLYSSTVFGDKYMNGVEFRRGVLEFSGHIATGMHYLICLHST